MNLETDRVKKLIRSACQFSSAELTAAISILKLRLEEKKKKEYSERKRSWAKTMKFGDEVYLRSNNYRIPYGTKGIIQEVRLLRAPNIAAVYIKWEGSDSVKGHYIRDLEKPGIILSTEIQANRGLQRIFHAMP